MEFLVLLIVAGMFVCCVLAFALLIKTLVKMLLE